MQHSAHTPVQSLSDLWTRMLDGLRERINAYGFESFVSKLTLQNDTGTHLVIAYPADMCIDWVEINYADQIRDLAAQLLDGSRQLTFERVYDGTQPAPAVEQSTEEAPPAARKAGKPRRSTQTVNSQLNENYRFDNYIVGPNSEFAHAAAMAVAQSPKSIYNPLFIHGDSGLGKTHLMQAIGNAIKERDENCSVLYISSEEFTNDYIAAMTKKGDHLSNFRKKYRKVDVLLIDDVQFLGGKEKTQDEFFHTFNTLFDSQKRIVLSADCPAHEITKLEPRLVSRFESGLTVSIAPPSLETRIAILRHKQMQWKVTIPDDVIEFLAKSITRNVRRLEGALTRISIFSSFSERTPTVADVKEQLKDILREETSTQVSIDEIQRRVSEQFDIRLSDMSSRRRTANIAHPRQIAMYLSRQLTGSSLQDIGEAFGGRDHGTVIHAAKTIERKMKTDPQVRSVVEKMTSMFT
ncbi:chromosomal replication initiator protein DnaA [Akkermansia glycaniphila]